MVLIMSNFGQGLYALFLALGVSFLRLARCINKNQLFTNELRSNKLSGYVAQLSCTRGIAELAYQNGSHR